MQMTPFGLTLFHFSNGIQDEAIFLACFVQKALGILPGFLLLAWRKH
jgi:hypothetical protein